MVSKNPICLYNGLEQELQSGDSLIAASPSVNPICAVTGHSRWLTSAHITSVKSASYTMVANTIYLSLFVSGTTLPIQGVGLWVMTGSAGIARVAFYPLLSTGEAGTKVFESGDINVGTSGVAATSSLGSISLPPGNYICAILCNSTPTLSGISFGGILGSNPFGLTSSAYSGLGAVKNISSGWSSMPALGAMSTYNAYGAGMPYAFLVV
jgi:hypothetical protein